jgi:cellulose synthase/poly-beta-1,6-N-acetylglucosamine synthase-like glycosyltransferase
MLSVISLSFAVVAALLSLPAVVLLVEVLAALKFTATNLAKPAIGANEKAANEKYAQRLAVIVPAHNESAGIVPTLEDIKPQLKPGDRLIVVADNCSDDTAAVAASAGAEVIPRNDLTQIGKGYALGWAVNHVSADPPDFVVFIDADCRIQSDGIEKLQAVCGELRRPIQACFLMKTAEGSPLDHSLSEFTFLLRNFVRPLGLRNLNCPVQLMGTGMMFPWGVIRSAPLASGHLVEDLKLGLDLATLGKAPYFLPLVQVCSDFPVTEKGTHSQRQRWVQGHLGMILKAVPWLLFNAVRHRNLELLALTLDLLVPPLSLLGLLLVGTFVLTALAAMFGLSLAAFAIASINLLMFAFAVLLAWLRFGRDILPARAMASFGPQIFRKFRIYGQMLIGRTAAVWIRTDRGKTD